MKIPLWKQWLSYFHEFHIESAPSEYNPHLYVSLKDNRFQLSTANAIYSFEDKYDNFRDVFKRLDLSRIQIKEVLILGLGLASVPYMLEHQFNKDYEYTCVEIDENVIYLANQYALPKIKSSMDILCADAKIFMHQNQRKFDLLIVDIFLDDITPSHFTSEEFLQQCKQAISEDGLIIYNCLGQHRKDKQKSRKFFEDQFLAVFPESVIEKTQGNFMVLSRTDLLK